MSMALSSPKTINVLLIGNNPSDLSNIYTQLSLSRHVKYNAEVAFDMSDINKYVKKKKPDCIIIDDFMDKKELSELFNYLSKNSLTRNIPVTLVKNSNVDDKPRSGADEFILKASVTTESITRVLFNSLKIHDFRDYLRKSYTNRQRAFLGLSRSV